VNVDSLDEVDQLGMSGPAIEIGPDPPANIPSSSSKGPTIPAGPAAASIDAKGPTAWTEKA
jgi:hypothetical protein